MNNLEEKWYGGNYVPFSLNKSDVEVVWKKNLADHGIDHHQCHTSSVFRWLPGRLAITQQTGKLPASAILGVLREMKDTEALAEPLAREVDAGSCIHLVMTCEQSVNFSSGKDEDRKAVNGKLHVFVFKPAAPVAAEVKTAAAAEGTRATAAAKE